MELILIFSIFISFFVTLFMLPTWIKKAKKIGLVWEDMNKYGHPKNVAGSGGVIVILGFVLGVLFYIAIKTFILKIDITTIDIFASLTTILIASSVGLIDDFFGWAHGGLPAKLRILLMLCAAIPLMVINAGNTKMLGIEFGLIYPLLFIPIGIIGTTTTFNFLAGFNGLEAKQGILILLALAIVTYFTGNSWLSLIALCMISSLLAFYIFNKYPARVFAGDVLTYGVGALIAIIAILGDIEKIAIFFFIPYIIETVLKLRGNLKKQSFGKPNKDGSLDVPYEKFYGLEHVAIYILKKIKKDKKAYEKEVVFLINLFQILIIILGLILFRKSIFLIL